MCVCKTMCVCSQPCAYKTFVCSGDDMEHGEECSKRSKKYQAPDKTCKRKRKLKPQRSCENSSLKVTEHWIGELKVFNTEWPHDCVGGWAEQHCVSRQGREILTAGML